MSFNSCNNYLEVRINYKASKLNYIKKFYEDDIGTDVNSENYTFLVDFYNLLLLFELCHELMHFRQFLLMNNSQTIRSFLLEDSFNFLEKLPQMYYKNHDLYYFEYDATIRAFMMILKVIENKCKNLNTNSIIECNRYICTIIYHSYGHKYYVDDDVSFDYDNFTSPFSYSEFMHNMLSNNDEKRNFNFCVKDIKKIFRTQYIRLIYGLDISEKTDRLLYDFCMDNYSTVNMLNDIKKMSKRKMK